MSEERIQRILARAGIASRRKAEELIREGRVTVNGKLAEIGSKADPERDAIKLDGKRVQPHIGDFHYLLLNKPKGVMSTVADPQERPTVMDYLPVALRKALVPVGRLDFNTEGLILLTDDGDFAQHVAHPRYGGVKVYDVKVKGRPTETQLDRLRAGIPIEGQRTMPCRITPRNLEKERRRARRSDENESDNSWWIVELTEGRTRQIREMFFRVGHPVQKLRRVAIGPLRDPDLPLGAFRELTEPEVEKLRKATSRPKKARKPAAEKPAAKRTFPAPGTKKVDRSRPWRAEKDKGEVKEVKTKAPAAAAPPERKPARKSAGKPAGAPARERRATPPVRRTTGEALGAAARERKAPARPAGKPTRRPSGKPSGRRPSAGPRRGR